MISKEFVAAGNATFTIEMNPEFSQKHNLNPHYTFKVRKKEASMKFPESWFVSLLTGRDNENSYSYLGMLDPKEGKVALTRASKMNEDSMVVKLLRRSLERIWKNETKEIEQAGFKIHHEGRCGRCGRKLTVPESIETGLGPECAGKI